MDVLVAMDNSKASRLALNQAIKDLNTIGTGSLTALYCETPTVHRNNGSYIKTDDQQYSAASDVIQTAVEAAEDSLSEQIDLETSIIEAGDSISSTLISHINTNDYDKVYVGYRDIPPKTKRFTGSTTAKLLGQINIPLVVV